MRPLAMSLTFLLLAATAATAHEEGVIRLGANQVAAGDTLLVRGEKLPKSATLRLELRGTLDTFALGEVRTDSAGKFTARPTLPEAVPDGNYRVVVIAADGDVAARADLVVLVAEPTMPHGGDDEMAGHMGAMEAPEATAELMDLPLERGAGETTAIIALIGLSLAAGLLLLRRSAARA